jgi:hypothetical protein
LYPCPAIFQFFPCQRLSSEQTVDAPLKSSG